MENPFPPKQLSAQAFQELKAISHAEFGADMSDDEIEDMGLRLLRLFSLIVSAREKEMQEVTVNVCC